ncbi:hypothetical protein NQ315_011338 [Exocentrus adspersus]|uniref:Putative nuclease HARBI1 n=1 Tax=Exocentrus adspersus TaxID=1586481 RepID=A0AAV8VJZ1_9CUCU|nr:hypothetical protein NQ315_011338 [Exocentrus adspersus]
MSRTTFEYTLRLIFKDLSKKPLENRQGRPTIDAEKQLPLALWVLSTPDSYRSVCDRFNVGRATAIRTVRRVVKALIKLKSRFISWPNHQEALHTAAELERASGFPGVIGIIDGTHIKIPAPKENSAAYLNRKNVHSIQLQVVCNQKRKFTHCYVGQSGSMHDQRVLRVSPLRHILNSEEYFPENSHLIGDAAYSVHPHLLTPFKDNDHLSRQQLNYNNCLSSARMTIERAIGLLKCRFRSLLDKLYMTRTDLIPYTILACCILHNICIDLNDFIEVPLVLTRNEDVQGDNPTVRRRLAERKRQHIMENLRIRI